jgi:hypothetical protein
MMEMCKGLLVDQLETVHMAMALAFSALELRYQSLFPESMTGSGRRLQESWRIRNGPLGNRLAGALLRNLCTALPTVNPGSLQARAGI